MGVVIAILGVVITLAAISHGPPTA